MGIFTIRVIDCDLNYYLDFSSSWTNIKDFEMGLILLIIIVLLLILALPTWPYSREWGYRPTGVMSVILVVLLVLILIDIIKFWSLEVKTNDNKTTIEIERKADY